MCGEETIVRDIRRPLGTYEMYTVEVIGIGEILRRAYYQLDLTPPDMNSSDDELFLNMPLKDATQSGMKHPAHIQ